MALLSSFGKYKDLGLLLMRIGLGLFFITIHGFPKLAGGPEMWTGVGSAMSNVNIHFFPAFWGFMAALAEGLGGLFLLLGLFYRPACIFLLFTMVMAGIYHLSAGDGMATASRAFEMAVVFFGLMFVGPGKYSLDKR